LAEGNATTQPAVSDDHRINGGANSLKVQDSLKPFVLSQEKFRFGIFTMEKAVSGFLQRVSFGKT
jgi:hypothetical protein